MALGFIPRFSPSFSPAEFLVATRALLAPGDEGGSVQNFESTFASFEGARNAIMMPSARFGFYSLLKAWGIGPGDEVVIPALTYFAIPGMAITAGCTPVFADIDRTSYTLDPAAFEAAITDRTKAVVPTHLFGIPADMDPIVEIARSRGIKVIEDCAQATGAWYGNGRKRRRVGSLGDAAYYTFGLTKNMTTLKGAMITLDDDEAASRIRADIEGSTPLQRRKLLKEVLTGSAMAVATHPLVYPFTVHPAVILGNALGKDPIHDRFGEAEVPPAAEVSSSYYAAGPRAAQAEVGLTQLTRLASLNGARIRNGRYLDENLAYIPGLTRPTWPEKSHPIFMSYVVQHPDRQAFAAALRRRGVDTTIGYMSDCSTSPLFPDHHRHCPNATEAFRSLLHLPVHPNLSERDLRHMVEATREAAHELDA